MQNTLSDSPGQTLADIEKYHREMAALLTDILEGLKSCATTQSIIMQLINDLAALLCDHIVQETDTLCTSGYNSTLDHMKDHDLLLHSISALTIACQKNERLLAKDLVNNLKACEIKHFWVYDRDIAGDDVNSTTH